MPFSQFTVFRIFFLAEVNTFYNLSKDHPNQRIRKLGLPHVLPQRRKAQMKLPQSTSFPASDIMFHMMGITKHFHLIPQRGKVNSHL